MKASILSFIVLLTLTGCGERQGLAPVEELHWVPFNHLATYHRVKPHETLYSIAFRYEKDYHTLVSLNNMTPPYTIRPGQRIRLVGKTTHSARVSKLKRHKEPQRLNSRNKIMTQAKALTWQWPLRGTLVQSFSPQQGRKGIDISVKRQQSVRASFQGVVAYSGHGIPGYGHLIIIKHNQQYLTAYAHNAKNLVSEGDDVKKGQIIAYTGLISGKKRGLHFELRKNGKPINPLQFLS